MGKWQTRERRLYQSRTGCIHNEVQPQNRPLSQTSSLSRFKRHRISAMKKEKRRPRHTIPRIENSESQFRIHDNSDSLEFRIMTIQNLLRFRITANCRITDKHRKPQAKACLKPGMRTTGWVSPPATRVGRRRHGRRRARHGGGTATEKSPENCLDRSSAESAS